MVNPPSTFNSLTLVTPLKSISLVRLIVVIFLSIIAFERPAKSLTVATEGSSAAAAVEAEL